MRPTCRVLVAFACLAWALLVQAQAPAEPLAALRAEIAALIDGGTAPGATWAIQVVSAESGAVWFERDPARLMVPASNTKLFTVAMALDRFGTNGTFATEWRWNGTPDATGTLPGDAWLMAGGDPSPGGGWSEPRALAGAVDALARAGVRRIQGQVLLRDAWFDAPPFGPGWNWDDLPEAYGAPVTGFQWADNAVTVVVEPGTAVGAGAVIRTLPIPGAFQTESTVRTVASNVPARVVIRRSHDVGRFRFHVSGAVRLGHPHVERMAVPNATEWFAAGLRSALQERGVAHGGVAIAPGPPNPSEPATPGVRIPSPPLGKIAALCLKPSNNRIAHALWLQVGADVRRNPRPDEAAPKDPASEALDDNDRAALAMERFAARVGIPRGDVVLEEGSGLSRKNLVTPRATVRLLRAMDASPAAAAWNAALPVGGVDGTLRGRFQDAAIQGRVIAKTGSLRHVHSLAGYVTTAGGQRLAFALYANGHASPADASSGRADIDRIATRLAAFKGRGPQ